MGNYSWLKKIYRHYIVKNLLIFFVVCMLVYISALIMLSFYTRHGEFLPVPDLKGLTAKDAGVILRNHSLRGKLVDSIYLATAKPGVIVGQIPEANSAVKENRTIYFVVNATLPEMVRMPDVVGVSLRHAESVIEAQGLKVGKLFYVPDIARNNVLRQTYKGKDIRKGVKIVKGASIDLYLGSGYN
ncbi:MAG: PASTA domain-containing protein [Bacteroidales bacterium]|jgi:beta-lactam-binding protein with PASTA domain|nr:PASTA domain-containing protein [Bacteroidales bacterium]